MGQVASLFALDADSFAALPRTGAVDFSQLAVAHSEGFDGSFMALEFLLQRLRPESRQLLTEIFSAEQTVQTPPFSGLRLDLLIEEAQEAYFEYLSEAVQYLNPAQVAAINRVLEGITADELAAAYDAAALNEQRIYPEIWSNDPAPARAFNLPHLLTDFQHLQRFFAQAAASELFVLCTIG